MMWLAIKSVSSPQATPDIMSVVSYVFLPVLGYLVMAVLAVTPHTHVLRVALWPAITSLALRAAASVDVQVFCKTLFTFLMFFIAGRTLDWSLANEQLVQYQPLMKGSRSFFMDGLDLALTLRGRGWNWARKVYIPRETRPTNRRGFTLYVILSGAIHALMCGALHISIRSFSPAGHGSLSGGSIFDDTLPFHVQYLRATVITIGASVWVYAFIQVTYDVCTVIAVVILGHGPAQWPPAFDAPWCPTSVAKFWGCKWHQFFRRMFLIQGGIPLAYLFGRTGLVIGSFLSSGVLHHIAAAMLNDWQLEPWRVIGGFGMMAPGVLAEEVFKKWTGRKVGGVFGWIWSMTWLLVWGSLIVDGFARAGVFGGHLKFTESILPLAGRARLERLVASFDSWLHTM